MSVRTRRSVKNLPAFGRMLNVRLAFRCLSSLEARRYAFLHLPDLLNFSHKPQGWQLIASAIIGAASRATLTHRGSAHSMRLLADYGGPNDQFRAFTFGITK